MVAYKVGAQVHLFKYPDGICGISKRRPSPELLFIQKKEDQ
jgi:hypothetical protein